MDHKLELNKDGFYKYNSIENHYNVKYLNKIPQEVKDAKWVTSEKLDGSNLSLYFTPNQPMKVGKRSGWIPEGENFYDAEKLVMGPNAAYSDILDYFQEFVNKYEYTIRFYAELYGQGVQKRCNYGPSKYVKVFDIVVNDYILPPKDFIPFVESHSDIFALDKGTKERLKSFFTEYKIYPNLVEALAEDVEKDDYEGIVLKPYQETVWLFGTDRLILKKKSVKFSDIAEEKITGKIKNFDPAQLALSEEFKRYITKNRMLDLFSKHGEMQDIKEMGKYIKLFMEDAKEDYLKTHNIDGLDQDTVKSIFNVGSMAANMLREHIQSNAKI